MGSPEKQSSLYVLWAEYTWLFKVGYMHGSVDERALQIAAMSPLPLRIVAERAGGRRDELALHIALRQYRDHGEWFFLPEHAVRWLLGQFGITSEHIEAQAA